MGEKMSLEMALAAIDRSIRALRECRMPEHAAELTEARAAVSVAFVTQPAQAVDVGAIREVIAELRKWPPSELVSDHRATRIGYADKLTATLTGKQPPSDGVAQPAEATGLKANGANCAKGTATSPPTFRRTAVDNPVSTQFPIRVMSFADSGDGDEVSSGTLLADVTDAGEGFAEVAMTYGEERVYIAFRVSDLMRAIKEVAHD